MAGSNRGRRMALGREDGGAVRQHQGPAGGRRGPARPSPRADGRGGTVWSARSEREWAKSEPRCTPRSRASVPRRQGAPGGRRARA
eukprot:2100020-Rhodomonas_salina.2